MKASSTLRVLLALMAAGTACAQLRDLDHVNVDSGRVFYEQRLYRNPLPGLLLAKKAVPAGDSAELVPLFQGIPLGGYRLGQGGVTVRPLTREERRTYHQRHPLHPLTYRFDFRIHPEFIANFGNFRRPVESRTSVLLQSQLYLWRGMVVNYGLLFPLVNHLDGRPNRIRPAPFYLNQFLAVGAADFLSLSAGLFANDHFGFNAQYQHLNLNSPWTYGLEAGVTGFYYYPRGGIYYDSLDELLVLANVAYRFSAQDLTVKLSGGQFLAQDRGVRMDLVRQFANVEIALYATKSGNGATVGFNLAVPIPPGKIAQTDHLRVRTTEEFRWEYTYTRGYRIGERYRMGYQLDEKLRQYHRSYLSNQLRRLEHG